MSEPDRNHKTEWRPIDRVALVLASSLGFLVNLILVVTLVQIIDHPARTEFAIGECYSDYDCRHRRHNGTARCVRRT